MPHSPTYLNGASASVFHLHLLPAGVRVRVANWGWETGWHPIIEVGLVGLVGLRLRLGTGFASSSALQPLAKIKLQISTSIGREATIRVRVRVKVRVRVRVKVIGRGRG